MDDFTTEIIASAEDANAGEGGSQPSQHDEDNQQQAQKKGWGGLAGLRDRTSLQDRLVDRYMLRRY